MDIQIADLNSGTAPAQELINFCGYQPLIEHARQYSKRIRMARAERPANLVGGQALLNAKRPLNTFAADLSPILRRYFSSSGQSNTREIAERAYVSSEEVTEYDRILEAVLRDKVAPRRDSIVQTIKTTRHDEPLLTKALLEYQHTDEQSGQLQIIQGAVGSGKSLFAWRYHYLLEPRELKTHNNWSFIDFNGSPASLKNGDRWLCQDFLESFERDNPHVDIYAAATLRGIFSRKIQQRKAYYDSLRAISPDEENRARSHDIANWQSDPIEFAAGIANYVTGGLRHTLVVVMDNVDKLDLDNQIFAFQLALWFMARTKAFIILQMRDETYERYKNKPPLDTFRSGIAFHIIPPRFIDVVKRRLELGIEYLAAHAIERQEYILDNGPRVVLPSGELGTFLKTLYQLLFGRRGNVSRVLEAIAGRDVRKALEMFVAIVTSGHLSTSAITSNVKGAGEFPINEYHIIRILMRTDYRFFSDNSPNISNIFHYDNDWVQPDNFLLIEILYFLCTYRKQRGELGLEGYFSVNHVSDVLQKLGYDRADVAKGINYLLSRQLIIADNFNTTHVGIDDCVRIQASGFMHLRVLSERLEYLYGVIPVVPISDPGVAARLADFVNRESQRGSVQPSDMARAVQALVHFLKYQLNQSRERNPFFDRKSSGAVYVLNHMDRALLRFHDRSAGHEAIQDNLDL